MATYDGNDGYRNPLRLRLAHHIRSVISELPSPSSKVGTMSYDEPCCFLHSSLSFTE